MKTAALFSLLCFLEMPLTEAQTVTTGCPFDSYANTMGTGVGEGQYMGQTITPAISGVITQIKFWYTSSGAQSGDGTHTAVLYLSQNPDTGALTNIIDTFDFPAGVYYPEAADAYTYTFSTPYPVSAGQTYRFELRNPAGGDDFGLWFGFRNPDAYTSGQGYYGGSPMESENSYIDMFFQYTMSGTPLPVTLARFDAYKKDKVAALAWATATERGSKGFEIERNTGGKWVTIGFVESKSEGGNSSGKLEYTFNDERPASGRNMYRLKQTGYDDNHTYSLVRMVDFGREGSIYIYPNPAKDRVTIAGLQGGESIRVYDVSGRSVRTVKAMAASASIDLRDLSEGIYNIRITGTDGKAVSYSVSKSN